MLLVVASQSQVRSPQGQSKSYIDYWNECVHTFQEEEIGAVDGSTWAVLMESYKSDPPNYVSSPDRLERLEKVIQLTERRLKALKKLRDIERGRE